MAQLGGHLFFLYPTTDDGGEFVVDAARRPSPGALSRRDEGAGDSAEAAAAGTVSDGIARRQGGSFATARRRGPTRLTQSCEAWRAGAQLNTDGGPSCRRA